MITAVVKFLHSHNKYLLGFAMCQPCSSYWKHTHIYTDTKLTKINTGLEEGKYKQSLIVCWDIGGGLTGQRERGGRVGVIRKDFPSR